MVTPKKIEEQFTSIYHYILIGCYCSILFVASAMYCTIPQTNRSHPHSGYIPPIGFSHKDSMDWFTVDFPLSQSIG